MAIRRFAAIDVGSYELMMTVAECSPKKGIRVLDRLVHRIDLGTDTYRNGVVSGPRRAELIRVLTDFAERMREYRVDAYRAYATSAIRESRDAQLILDQIQRRTGIRVEILSNSEQRFLDYKAVASMGERFTGLMEESTAIVDIGGSTLQLSLFDKDRLVLTQKMRLGVLWILEQLRKVDAGTDRRERMVRELVGAQMEVFAHLYPESTRVRNLILVDDYASPVLMRFFDKEKAGEQGLISLDRLSELIAEYRNRPRMDLARSLAVDDDRLPMALISVVIVETIAQTLHARKLWVSGAELGDGMIYDLAEEEKILRPAHDFEQDILACAENMAQRYRGITERHDALREISEMVFDAVRTRIGLTERERLLLKIACILHDCGKFITMEDSGQCSYDIILSTEIIGLSHIEREIVANVVRFNRSEFIFYGARSMVTDLDEDSYLTIARLTAILRIASGLDRAHRHKLKGLKAQLRDEQLILTVDGEVDLSLEKGLFKDRAEFFREIFGYEPVIRQRGGN